MSVIIKEAAGYTLASAAALLLDMTVLWTLVNFLSWNYLAAAATSFLAGSIVAYELSVRIAFRQHRLQERRAELAAFVAIGVMGLAVNSSVIFIMVRYLGVHYLLAKCVAAGCSFTCNFMVRRQLLFVRQASSRRVVE
jgi:putative flippase GtrA